MSWSEAVKLRKTSSGIWPSATISEATGARVGAILIMSGTSSLFETSLVTYVVVTSLYPVPTSLSSTTPSAAVTLYLCCSGSPTWTAPERTDSPWGTVSPPGTVTASASVNVTRSDSKFIGLSVLPMLAGSVLSGSGAEGSGSMLLSWSDITSLKRSSIRFWLGTSGFCGTAETSSGAAVPRAEIVDVRASWAVSDAVPSLTLYVPSTVLKFGMSSTVSALRLSSVICGSPGGGWWRTRGGSASTVVGRSATWVMVTFLFIMTVYVPSAPRSAPSTSRFSAVV